MLSLIQQVTWEHPWGASHPWLSRKMRGQCRLHTIAYEIAILCPFYR